MNTNSDKPKTTHWYFNNQLFFGILIGVFLWFSVFLCYQKFFLTQSPVNYKGIFFKGIIIQDKLFDELKTANVSLEEKNNSINKRIDDLYILGGVIITLLLAINIGVFVKSKHDVDKYLDENYEINKTKIAGLVKDAEMEFALLHEKFEIYSKLMTKLDDQQKKSPKTE